MPMEKNPDWDKAKCVTLTLMGCCSGQLSIRLQLGSRGPDVYGGDRWQQASWVGGFSGCDGWQQAS